MRSGMLSFSCKKLSLLYFVISVTVNPVRFSMDVRFYLVVIFYHVVFLPRQ